MSTIEIKDYNSRYHADFKRLNLYWLDKYNLTESHDLMILDDPEKHVINKDGSIFLAMDGEKVVGTVGIAKESESVYELVKFAVDPEWQGRGIGKIMLERCLQVAKAKQARKIFLFSNSQLRRALSLYEKYGFRSVPPTDSPLLTADVKMELILQ